MAGCLLLRPGVDNRARHGQATLRWHRAARGGGDPRFPVRAGHGPDRPGEEVRWVNCDAVQHTATADAGAWDSGMLAKSAVYGRVFPAAGRFEFHCEPHPFMTGTVVVE